jgi:hypothetical protein
MMRLQKILFISRVISSKHQNIHGTAFSLVTDISYIESLILQFYRLANIYFLLIAILQTIPIISPLSPATAWAPLVVVLAISMIR